MPGFCLPHRRKLSLENVERVLLLRFDILKLHRLQNDIQRIADAAKLPPVAPDVIEDLSLEIAFRRIAEVDIDQAELSALLISRYRIDRLPKLIRRERSLKGVDMMLPE